MKGMFFSSILERKFNYRSIAICIDVLCIWLDMVSCLGNFCCNKKKTLEETENEEQNQQSVSNPGARHNNL